jgi:hypothetical protein
LKLTGSLIDPRCSQRVAHYRYSPFETGDAQLDRCPEWCRIACPGWQDLTEETDEMTEGMVAIMAVFAQIEKKRLVKKLRAARDRKSFDQAPSQHPISKYRGRYFEGLLLGAKNQAGKL